ncbi:glycosyltransferase [soil metagenome]
MKILHVIPSLSPRYGGPSAVLPVMARALIAQGLTVDVATICDEPLQAMIKETIVVGTNSYRSFAFARQTSCFRISLPLAKWLKKHIQEYDVVHVHAVFTFSSLATCYIARQAGVPYIVRPLGILNSWGMENRRKTLKKIWFRLIEKPFLDKAAAMHYTSDQERDDAARLRIRSPAQVLPLGLDLSKFSNLPHGDLFHDRFPQLRHRRILLFLSRIHPKKGFDLLLPAFAQLVNKIPDIALVVGGDGTSEYLHSLQEECKSLELEDSVLWVGFLDETARLEALAAATVFCLPSWSENFGVALLEAMAAGLPCIATDQVALAIDAAQAGAVLMISCDVEALEESLLEMFSNPSISKEMGMRAAKHACDYYSMEAMGKSLIQFYQTVVHSRFPR